jgi:hypothetical protein
MTTYSKTILRAEAIFVIQPGISPAKKSARSEPSSTSISFGRTCNNWTDQVYDSISWSAYRSTSAQLTDSFRTFVVKFSHSWLPIGVRERRCSATTDLCPECNEIRTVPHLYRCQVRATWRYYWFLMGTGNTPLSVAALLSIGT